MSEKRLQQRHFPSRVHARLQVKQSCINVQLLDESSTGVGVFLSDPLPLDVGQHVSLGLTASESVDAVVCHIEPHPLGGLLVGLECCARSDEASC